MALSALAAGSGPWLTCATAAASERSWHLTVYGMRWAHENLVNIPYRGATRTLDWRDHYFLGAAASKVLLRELPFERPFWRHSRIEAEAQYIYHFGGMDHSEVTAALVWRTPDWALPGGFRINAAHGQGLSYAFDEPVMESARKGRPTQRALWLLSFELELTHRNYPNLHLVPRVHHRSGVFGLVGPAGDGSNYLGLGLRMSLP